MSSHLFLLFSLCSFICRWIFTVLGSGVHALIRQAWSCPYKPHSPGGGRAMVHSPSRARHSSLHEHRHREHLLLKMVHELRASGPLCGSSACVSADGVVSSRRYKQTTGGLEDSPSTLGRLQTPIPTLPAAGRPADTNALLKEENN